jgi:pseudouridine synthase
MKDQSTLPLGLVRLEKHMAQSGMASRREAKDLIASRKISVNGIIIREAGFGVDPKKDLVMVVGKIPAKKSIILFKPRGIETSKTSSDSRDIHDEFPQFKNLAPIGRLDKDSEGMIILSDDGILARAITGEKSDVEKEYLVTVRESITPAALERMARGIVLDGKKTLPAETNRINEHQFSIVLREGRKHQIRRMADACKLTIERLVRVRIGGIKSGNMKTGEFKELSEKEIASFKK